MQGKQISTEDIKEKLLRLNIFNRFRAYGYIEGLLDGQEIAQLVNELTPQQMQRVKDFVAGLTGN